MQPEASGMATSSIRAVAALEDPSRRGMYDFIRDARRPVTREEAADAIGISRKLAAFHLDKLVEAGVLAVAAGNPRRIGRVGRSPKTYEPVSDDIAVTIPARRPVVLAEILTQAIVTAKPRESARAAALRVASEQGEELGVEARTRMRGGRLGSERALQLLRSVLEERGFEPFREDSTCLRLRNCPFQPLAAEAPELVCGINHAFLDGFVTGIGAETVRPVLAPRAGECCVELRGAAQPSAAGGDTR